MLATLVKAVAVCTGRQVLASRIRSFASRINETIDLTNPKVVHSIEMKAGEKKVLCRCWKSATFPLCDGAHSKHNKVRL